MIAIAVPDIPGALKPLYTSRAHTVERMRKALPVLEAIDRAYHLPDFRKALQLHFGNGVA